VTLAPRAFLITDGRVADEAATVKCAAAVVARLGPTRGRHVMFGVRARSGSARACVELARALVAVARPGGVRVVVHDRLDIAAACAADGVQLGERSVEVHAARAFLGERAWIGRSCHDAAGLARAYEDGADAATLSPVFGSPGKGIPLGPAAFGSMRAAVPTLPVIALGGIDAGRVRTAVDAGANGVAMIRAWLMAADPASLVEEIVAAFESRGRSVA
jgi:thiamine-phosphate pyrophosphorylase